MAEPSSAPEVESSAAQPAAKSDPLSRLEAAGVEDIADEYEDLSDLGIESPGEETESLDGTPAERPDGEDEPLEEDVEEKPQPEPEDALGLKGKGTRETPLRHKDLPADKFVEVKTASGEKVVVNLKDALAGTFMSRDKVNQVISEANQAKQQAHTIGEQALEHQKAARAYVQHVLSDPLTLVKALVENNWETMRGVSYAFQQMEQDPTRRQKLILKLQNDRVAAQSREIEQRRQAQERQQQEAAQQAELQRTLGPAYRQGLKDAGILRPEDVTDELQDGIRMRFNFLMEKNGRTPSREEMRWCVVKAAAELKARGQLKPPPRPRAAPVVPPEQRPRASNGETDWSKVPEHIRMRDPKFLFNKRARASVRGSS